MLFHRKWAFVSTLWAQKVADCVTLSSSLLVSRVSWSSLRAASTTPASATSHLWWTVVDASSTGGPKATATGARPTLRRARLRCRARGIPANHAAARQSPPATYGRDRSWVGLARRLQKVRQVLRHGRLCFCYNGPACCVMPECEGHYC